MELQRIIESGANVVLSVKAADLKEFALNVAENARKTALGETAEQETYYTAKETAERLKVDVSTLWRWQKSGYLKPVRVGRKRLYRQSDLEKTFEMKGQTV